MILGIRGIEELTVYQRIFAKGKAEGMAEAKAEGKAEVARESLLIVGRRKLGPATPEVEARIVSLSDIDQLHELLDRVFGVATWDELLGPADPLA